MTTKSKGGVIRPAVALTCEAQYAAAVGDPVMVTGDYEVEKADGSAPCIGQVSAVTKAVPATGGNRTVQNPGDVTVESFGTGVLTFVLADTLAAGILVGIDSAGKLDVPGVGILAIGVLLTGGDADDEADVLVGVYA